MTHNRHRFDINFLFLTLQKLLKTIQLTKHRRNLLHTNTLRERCRFENEFSPS